MTLEKFINEYEGKRCEKTPNKSHIEEEISLTDSIATTDSKDGLQEHKKETVNNCIGDSIFIDSSAKDTNDINNEVLTLKDQRMVSYDVSDRSSDETYEDIKPKSANMKIVKKLNMKRTKKALAALKKKRESKNKQYDCFL